MTRRFLALSAVAATAIAVAGCAFPTTRPVTEASFDSATLVGNVGSLDDNWQGEYWFEYATGSSGVQRTPRRAISVVAPALEPMSASVTGLESLGEPVPGLQRVRTYAFRLCIQNPTYGPLCTSEYRAFSNGDYITGGGFFWDSQFGGEVTIYAESGPSGEEPSGHAEVDYLIPDSEPDIVGPVTCLAARGRYISVGVDNQQGPDALLELASKTGGGLPDDYLEIADPPADLSDCPAPDPTVVSGRFFQGLAGTGPTIVDGP
jgi:hypothetical protein